MKKTLMIVFLVALLAAVLPAGALAGKKNNFKISVRNRTDASAEISAVDANGGKHNFKVGKGWSTIQLPEGRYDYWVSSACGSNAGSWNLNVNKTLWIECGPLGPVAVVAKPVPAGGSPICSDPGAFVDWNKDPDGTWWVFLSQTNWLPDSSYGTWESYLPKIEGMGFDVIYGCVSDQYYDEYYIGE